jgi:hypothetical protein
MQVFGGKFNFPDATEDKPRHNFDSFWQSLLTVFQVSAFWILCVMPYNSLGQIMSRITYLKIYSNRY